MFNDEITMEIIQVLLSSLLPSGVKLSIKEASRSYWFISKLVHPCKNKNYASFLDIWQINEFEFNQLSLLSVIWSYLKRNWKFHARNNWEFFFLLGNHELYENKKKKYRNRNFISDGIQNKKKRKFHLFMMFVDQEWKLCNWKKNRYIFPWKKKTWAPTDEKYLLNLVSRQLCYRHKWGRKFSYFNII